MPDELEGFGIAFGGALIGDSRGGGTPDFGNKMGFLSAGGLSKRRGCPTKGWKES